MTDESDLTELQILVFNIKGCSMGTDMDHIQEIVEPDRLDRENLQIYCFHDGVLLPEGKTDYKSPMVLLIKHQERLAGVMVDDHEDILTIDIHSIYPLPPLLEACNKSAVWGVALQGEKIILLVDFCRLLLNY
ncbi:MAG: hypothetical protein GY795_15430 [Desulfobacterales bacterium]|nr:hypothetical protein [Desulfobacterales bacterium]